MAIGKNDEGQCDVPKGYKYTYISAGPLHNAALGVPIPHSVDELHTDGKKKKIGSTLPVKFQLFFENVPVQGQEDLATPKLAV